MDHADSPIVDNYVTAWRAGLPQIVAWEAIAALPADREPQGKLHRHLEYQVGARAHRLVRVIARHHGWPCRIPTRARIALPGGVEGRQLPLAMWLHRAALEGAFTSVAATYGGDEDRVREELALDVLVAGLAEVAAPPASPWALAARRHAIESAPPPLALTATSAESTWRDISLLALPPRLLAVLEHGSGAVQRITERVAAFDVVRTRSAMLAHGIVPQEDTRPTNAEDRHNEPRLFIRRRVDPLPLERLTTEQRNVVGQTDEMSRQAIAVNQGIGIDGVDALLASARRNGVFPRRDVLLWEAARLDGATWALVQAKLEGATLRGGEREVRSGRTGGPRPVANRSVVAAIIIVCRTGLAWADLGDVMPDLVPCSLKTAQRRLASWLGGMAWVETLAILTKREPLGMPIDWARAHPRRLARRAEELRAVEIMRLQSFAAAVTADPTAVGKG